MWHKMDDWLLRGLLSYVDEGDAYRLWVFAAEHRLERVCDVLTISSAHAPLSKARALHLAMAHACWTAVCRLTKAPRSQRLSRRTADHILHEIQRLVVPGRDHPDRETAILTAAQLGTVPQFVMYVAAQQGNLESVIWLHSVVQYDPSEALRIASRGGHGHVVAWLLDNTATAHWINPGCSIQTVFHFRDDPGLGLYAWKIFYGDELVDEAVFSTKWGFTDIGSLGRTEYRAADLAVIKGDLDGVKHVLRHSALGESCTSQAVDDAARAGHLDVLKWLHVNRTDVFLEANVFHCAAISGHLEVAQWAAGIRTKEESMDITFDEVVRHGHLDVLRWMVEQFPTSAALRLFESHLARACKEGHLRMAKWFVETHGFVVTPRLLSAAAMGGRLDVFQWVLTRLMLAAGGDVPLDPVLLRQAARGGNLEFVRWLVEERGLWSPSALASAARGASTDVIEYLYSVASARGNAQLDPRDMENPSAIQRGHFDVLAWRLRHGLTANHLNKEGFDRLKNLETTVAWTQAQLGWSEYTPLHERWPRTPAWMARFRALMRLIIDLYDPEFLRSITWLPAWAAQHGSVESLERLAAIHHASIFSPKAFRLLLRTSTDADKVKWFLTEDPSLFSTRVVQWAVQFDQRRLLLWLLEDFVPARQHDVASNSDLTFRCIQTALRSAQKSGREEIAALAMRLTASQ